MVLNPTELITSDKNTTVKLVKALLAQARQRKKHGQTVIEGVHLIDAALRSDYPLPRYYCLSQRVVILKFSRY
ncbi:hypothetical protein PKHYL_31770 [Psychrobacter sp. KH172YL61]|nr:hypothetical protein PKHYL_31770 [Psychrobacter sp. KH172YL61]